MSGLTAIILSDVLPTSAANVCCGSEADLWLNVRFSP
jgi:hypothetical protein